LDILFNEIKRLAERAGLGAPGTQSHFH